MLKIFKKKPEAKNDLKSLVGGLELPSFPQAVLNVLRALRDPESSMETVSEAIQADPGLVVRLLKTVNSAAFGLVRAVDNVHHASAMMGRSRLESLVLALAARDVLPRDPVRGYDASRFWKAAARRAALARALARKLHPATQTEAFTAALLQDMAIPILATARPKDYGPILEHWHQEPTADLHSLEDASMGWNHTQIGALMAEEWELPSGLRAAIKTHHGADAEGAAEPAVRLVSQVRETEESPGIDRLVELARQEYGLSPDEVVKLVEVAFHDAAALARLLQ